MDVNTAVGWINKYSYDVERTFYFFTHPGIMNRTFPCTTQLGGRTPARPCIFPVKYQNGASYDKCFLMDTPNPACLTKLIGNSTQDEEQPNYDMFGYCHPSCAGEMPGPESPHNLARGSLTDSAANRSIGSTTGCTITEKAPTRDFSWLKAPTSTFTFKGLSIYYVSTFWGL